ncbi:MAG TPA: molybdenum cofactor guanylyltransferase [Candidatus Acidoferrales bacterium]|nr:molybdenum cofactor guanylyltransferase [Candidatus Acidoferrales bacterium]
MTVSGIVLAGGRSSRFGGSKLDAELEGRPVVEWTIERLRRVCAEVLVIGREGPAVREGDIRFSPDAAPFEGPLAGLARGLELATGETVLVAGGDMPLLSVALLGAMIERLVASPGATDAVALVEGDATRPLPLVLRPDPARAAAAATLALGGRSLHGFLDRLRLDAMSEAAWRTLDPDADSLVDVDTEADLEAARARLRRADGMRP